ncbi:MAG: 5-formyltetrahydrofolate cyclo-ligase [Rickettsiaceae bacterium]
MAKTINEKKDLIRAQISSDNSKMHDCAFRSNEICKNILNIIYSRLHFINHRSLSNVIGVYWPFKLEPDILKLAISNNYYAALPKIQDNQMSFVKYNIGDKLEKNTLGFKQPSLDIFVQPKLVIIPGICFSLDGYRLGYGKGYYDKYLKEFSKDDNVISIGVCFHQFLRTTLPVSCNDYRCDYIVTEKNIIQI